MAHQRDRPGVPVVHADEREHRRLLATRVNVALPADGTHGMTAPLLLEAYAIAGLPDATLWEGGLVYVSDGGSGERLRYSDGTSWIIAG